MKSRMACSYDRLEFKDGRLLRTAASSGWSALVVMSEKDCGTMLGSCDALTAFPIMLAALCAVALGPVVPA